MLLSRFRVVLLLVLVGSELARARHSSREKKRLRAQLAAGSRSGEPECFGNPDCRDGEKCYFDPTENILAQGECGKCTAMQLKPSGDPHKFLQSENPDHDVMHGNTLNGLLAWAACQDNDPMPASSGYKAISKAVCAKSGLPEGATKLEAPAALEVAQKFYHGFARPKRDRVVLEDGLKECAVFEGNPLSCEEAGRPACFLEDAPHEQYKPVVRDDDGRIVSTCCDEDPPCKSYLETFQIYLTTELQYPDDDDPRANVYEISGSDKHVNVYVQGGIIEDWAILLGRTKFQAHFFVASWRGAEKELSKTYGKEVKLHLLRPAAADGSKRSQALCTPKALQEPAREKRPAAVPQQQEPASEKDDDGAIYNMCSKAHAHGGKRDSKKRACCDVKTHGGQGACRFVMMSKGRSMCKARKIRVKDELIETSLQEGEKDGCTAD